MRMQPARQRSSLIPAILLMATAATALVAISNAQRSGKGDMELSALVPGSIGDWTPQGDDATYDRDTIFEYMNGAGEVYLSFAYTRMFVRRFTNPAQDELTVEVYDMGNPSDAYGIFSRARAEADVGIGQGSEYRSGYLNFWKDRFFVTAYTWTETDETRSALLEIGRMIAEGIPDESDPPLLLTSLPADDLAPHTVRYFHLYTDLNKHYFVADQNILDLDATTEAVIANYETEDDYSFLLVIRYPGEERAERAFAAFMEIYMPDAGDSGTVRIEDGYWASAARTGEFLTAVFDASSSERAQQLLTASRNRIEGVLR
jgi:hypothetical protein